MKLAMIVALLSSVALVPVARAQAQQGAPPQQQQPPPSWTQQQQQPSWTQQPPPSWAPPCAPCYAAPLPTPAELDELERHGRHRRMTGIALMATGSALVVAGVALGIAGWYDVDNRCRRYYYYNGYADRYGYYDRYGWCGNEALAIAGATTSLLGVGVLAAGVPIYLAGNAQVRRARWLQHQLSLVPSVRPSAGAVHATATLALAF